MSFTTADTVQLYLNKTGLSLLETQIVNMLIDMVDGQIESYCGWNILARDYENVKVDGNDESEFDLGVLPVNTVTLVTISDGTTTTDVTDDILLKEEEGIIYLPDTAALTTFTSGTRNVTLTYNAGYVDIPSELVFAATQLVVIQFNRITQENVGVIEEEMPKVKVKYDKTDIPESVQRILNRYRKVFIL